MTETDVIQYILCEDESSARELLNDRGADAAWIFSENVKENLQRMAERKRCEPAVLVVEREDNVSMRFARQILVNKIYIILSYAVYVNFVTENIGLQEISDKELQEAYRSTSVV